ncbi:hypothetical protein DB30_06499 [Enhygromyxa salina]|uniref:Uncharacterized protein n=1 Tax=Enhygromyxa salina TaxID=215803 RepID=A0A0C2CY95_9BACT|nr:hypothetical protein DB30_06499 [Enhygromyxa salina]
MDVGVSFHSKSHDESPIMFTVRPAIGYRFDSLVGRRQLGELGLELGLFQDVNNAYFSETIGASYRGAFVFGSTPITEDVRTAALGVRHGPVLTYLSGILSLTFSHEYLGLPAPEHGLRVGVAVDLSPIVVLYWLVRGTGAF